MYKDKTPKLRKRMRRRRYDVLIINISIFKAVIIK